MHNINIIKEDFVNRIQAKGIDITNFIKRYESIQIVYDNETDNTSYNVVTNRININPSSTDDDINHEFLHILSTKESDDLITSGFYQIEIDTGITRFVGINEGYTEVINQRFFPEFKERKSYILLKMIAYRLEILCGEDNMLNAYLNGNFNDIYDYLVSITNEEDTKRFFRNLDCIAKINVKNVYFNYLEYYYYKLARNYLIKAFITLFTTNLADGLINDDDYVEGLNRIYDALGGAVYITKYRLPIIGRYSPHKFTKITNEIKKKLTLN